ncbi:MAG: CinA family nicotinamide mononucleotide deamidase-related protein [Planctomycetota bacterium]|nr:CinA family nicotinamide mononucleotide deamidase-related protein [Planctomycetota bacterium]
MGAEVATRTSQPGQFRVGVVAVGDEILEGRIQESHGRTISNLLTPLGFKIAWHLTVADAPGALETALKTPPSAADLIIITGGLGPTADDRTRQEIANAAGVPLEEDDRCWQRIRTYLEERGVSPALCNRQQAFRPKGSDWLENDQGTAPGLKTELPGGVISFALPGVPVEFDAMFQRHLLPWARERSGEVTEGEILEFVAIPESELDEWIVEQLGRGDSHHICVKGTSQIEVRLPLGVSLKEAAAERFQSRFSGLGGIGTEGHLVRAAGAAGQTLVLAESCTGGMISSRITDVSGSSEVFLGGWNCYSNAMKVSELAVSPSLIDGSGAVSAEVVEALAVAARQRSGADLALSASGVAGPTGGTEKNPVGTVWMGLASAAGVRSHRYQWTGNRLRIREMATQYALHALLAMVRGQEIHGWPSLRS